jgi:hypothetical protein
MLDVDPAYMMALYIEQYVKANDGVDRFPEIHRMLSHIATPEEWEIIQIARKARKNNSFKLRPDQTGDFLPRSLTRYNGERLAIAKSLPGVVIKEAFDNYKKVTGPSLVPTTTGWGFGPMQLDWVSHSAFLKTPAGRTARGQMEYAVKNVIKYSYDALKKEFPNFTHAQLLDATVAAYNAGVGGATKAIKAGKPLTSITAAPWYIPRVAEYGQKLATIFGGDSRSAVV